MSQAGFNQHGPSDRCSGVHCTREILISGTGKQDGKKKAGEADKKADLESVSQGRSSANKKTDHPMLKMCTNDLTEEKEDEETVEKKILEGSEQVSPRSEVEREGDGEGEEEVEEQDKQQQVANPYEGWCIYNGHWANGKADGVGTFTWADGRKYEGSWEAGRRKGLGAFHWPASGSYYKGEWKDDMREGFGLMMWGTSGDTYEGQWIADTFEGTGVYKWTKKESQSSSPSSNSDQGGGDSGAEIRRYEGQWKGGLRWGQGTMYGANGHKYIGAWVSDETCGVGRCVWADGREYNGEWKANRQHGLGKMTWPDGEFYDGSWREGRFHGRGTHVWPDGRKYEGEMKVRDCNNPPPPNNHNHNHNNLSHIKLGGHALGCRLYVLCRWRYL